MTAADSIALLDAHDLLIRACIAGDIGFEEFLLAYASFPDPYVFNDVATDIGRRVAFHRQVAGVLAGLSVGAGRTGLGLSDAADFFPAIGALRLRALLARYPAMSYC